MSHNYEEVKWVLDLENMVDHTPQGYLVRVRSENTLYIRDRGEWDLVRQPSTRLENQGYAVMTLEQDEVFGCWMGCYPMNQGWTDFEQAGADLLINFDILIPIAVVNYHLNIKGLPFAVNHPQFKFRIDGDTRRWAYKHNFKLPKVEIPEPSYPTSAKDIAKLLVE